MPLCTGLLIYAAALCGTQTIKDKIAHEKSWTDVVTLMGKLFPEYPSSKSRQLIEKIFNSVPQIEADRQHFYKETIDLNFIGPRCEAAGISRCCLSKPPVLDNQPLTRGILLELGSCYGGDLYSVINHLYIDKYGEKIIRVEHKTNKSTFSKFNKPKNRNDATSGFLNEIIVNKLIQTPQEQLSASSRSDPKSTPSKNPTRKVASHKMVQDKDKEVKVLKEKENILSDICKEKSQQIKKMDRDFLVVERNLIDKNTKLKTWELEMKVLKEKLAEKCNEIKNLKSSSVYHKLRRKTLHLNQKEAKVQTDLRRCSEMENKTRTKVKGIQRKL
ncbi:uncharacterized protein [Asterias amurensis]|uniref:uncharacterized protein n=1 Tax=Asterias amurensis TaxID=7602 RepID=UPI003AB6112D